MKLHILIKSLLLLMVLLVIVLAMTSLGQAVEAGGRPVIKGVADDLRIIELRQPGYDCSRL